MSPRAARQSRVDVRAGRLAHPCARPRVGGREDHGCRACRAGGDDALSHTVDGAPRRLSHRHRAWAVAVRCLRRMASLTRVMAAARRAGVPCGRP